MDIKNGLSIAEVGECLNEIFSHDDVNIEEVKEVLSKMNSDESIWRKYCHFDQYHYTRNLINAGNDKYNLILLCWGQGQGSGVHDHAGAHCFMKVLSGQIMESLYAWPKIDESDQEKRAPLELLKTANYKPGEIAYISDKIGLHRVENPSHTNSCVTLHLYCPPFKLCKNFDQATGKSYPCRVTFWSSDGQIQSRRKNKKSHIFKESH